MTKYLTNRVIFSPAIIVSAFMVLTGCQTMTPSSAVINSPDSAANTQVQTLLTPAVQTVVGDYASEDYDKRAQGYDWVGVLVRPYGDADIDIKVRARSDIKNPSCSFDGRATLMGQDNAHGVIFQTIANNSVTFLQFKEGKLTIDSQDKQALNYFCSGGVTFAGDYQKLAGKLKFS